MARYLALTCTTREAVFGNFISALKAVSDKLGAVNSQSKKVNCLFRELLLICRRRTAVSCVVKCSSTSGIDSCRFWQLCILLLKDTGIEAEPRYTV